MPEILFCGFYFLLFSAIILRSRWFKAGGFTNLHFLLLFYLKLLFGTGLWFLYTYHYKNRLSTDIFKYFDDAKIIFATLHSSVKDYLVMLTGIGDRGDHYQYIYHNMNSWDNGYGSIVYNNSHFIIRLNAFMMLFSQCYYGVHVIFMCFISLTGLLYIYKYFTSFLFERRRVLFAATFLFPSVILWSSGILKEAPVWLGLGLSVYYFFNPAEKKSGKLKNVFFVFLGFLLLYEAKAYVLLCLAPGFIAQVLIRNSVPCRKRPLTVYFSVLLIYMSCALLPHAIFHAANPLQMISDKQTEFNRIGKGGIYLEDIKYGNMQKGNDFALISVADSTDIVPLNNNADSLLRHKGIQYLASNPVVYNEWTKNAKIPFALKKGTPFSYLVAGIKDTLHLIADGKSVYWIYIYIETANSRINIEPIKPRLSSLLLHLPDALKVALLLPYPWQVHSVMTGIYCAENIFVILLIIIALLHTAFPLAHKDIALFCLSYSLMMLTLIGLVTPILGGIERYKSTVIPFMFILLLLITDKQGRAKNKQETDAGSFE